MKTTNVTSLKYLGGNVWIAGGFVLTIVFLVFFATVLEAKCLIEGIEWASYLKDGEEGSYEGFKPRTT